MKFAWILSEEIDNTLLEPKAVKDTAVSWGSSELAAQFEIDNCVCSNNETAQQHIRQNLQERCNLYVTQQAFVAVGRPTRVKIFQGRFGDDILCNKDDIVALNLAVPTADIILLAGFNFSPVLSTDDKEIQDSRLAYYANVRAIIAENIDKPFVLVNYNFKLASWLLEFDNVTQDTVENVVSLLAQ